MANRYSPEVRARAVRMMFEHQGSYETQAGGETDQYVGKDSGMRDGVTTNTLYATSEQAHRTLTFGRSF